jgi:hypothetical protein
MRAGLRRFILALLEPRRCRWSAIKRLGIPLCINQVPEHVKCDFRSKTSAGEALLPAAGERPRDLILAPAKTEARDLFAGGAPRVGDAVNAGDELEILPHREIAQAPPTRERFGAGR